MSVATLTAKSGATAPASTLGERLRELRKQAGLSQSALAGGRFSKEYVSQIERGKTHPNSETLTWLAERLGVDTELLEHGIASDDRSRLEATLARGEALLEAKEFTDAAKEFEAARANIPSSTPELQLRALCGESWALMQQGEPQLALKLIEKARALSEGSRFSELDRADVLFRMGACRTRLSSNQTAITLLSEALTLAETSGLPCDRLRSDIFRWRSLCYRRLRDWEAASEDISRALELAEALDDPSATANAYFHASGIAERTGHWVLARSYAERAKIEYERIEDRRNVGRLLNNLGGLNFLLGNADVAVHLLKQSFSVALETDAEEDAAYAISSLAQVHLKTDRPELAEEQATKALELLAGRDDRLDEVGNAQLVLGRALLEQGRVNEADEWIRASESSFEQFGSPGHRSAAWIARGDLETRRGDYSEAARLYRLAAEVLQDVRF
jgi:tetratricopeptide (TPR) repeat protein